MLAGCDPADVLRGGVDAAAGDERALCCAWFLTVGLPPVLLGNAVSWPIYRRLRKAHPEYFVRKTISEELKEAVEQEQKKKPAAKPVSDPVQTPEPDISPTEALFGPESSGTAPGAFHNAQDEAMLFYEDDDDES